MSARDTSQEPTGRKRTHKTNRSGEEGEAAETFQVPLPPPGTEAAPQPRPTRAEKRRDKILQNIYDRSAKRLRGNDFPQEGSSGGMDHDKISLSDTNLDVPNLDRSELDLWGRSQTQTGSTSPLPPSGSILEEAEEASSLNPSHPIIQPEFQTMITMVLKQALGDSLQSLNLPSTSTSQQTKTIKITKQAKRTRPPSPSSDSSSPEDDEEEEEEESEGQKEDPFLCLSDEEEEVGEPSASTSLFPPDLFKALLNKARIAAGLDPPAPSETTATADSRADPVFVQAKQDKDEIPMPQLFLEAISHQWSKPVAGPSPTNKDKRLYNVATPLADLLLAPRVDDPIKALHLPTAMPGEAEEVMKAEDRRLEQVLRKGHLSAAWAIKATSSAAFFARTIIIWLRQIQQHIPPDDLRAQQDLNKTFAAAQYVADATLQASRFSAKSMAASVVSRRLHWLKPWQAGVRQKWQLAIGPIQRNNLFGGLLQPLLVKTADKKKILPPSFKKSTTKFSPAFRRSFRQPDQGTSYNRPTGQFNPRNRPQPDRGGRGRQYRGQSRGLPFSRPFRRSRW